MNLKLAYGRGHLEVDLPDERTTVIAPTHQPGLENERTAVINAIANATGARVRSLPALPEKVLAAMQHA